MDASDKLPDHLLDTRPWGRFEQFIKNEKATVKIITVNPGEAFSLQTHGKREEFWRVIMGSGTVTIAEKTYAAKGGDSFLIPKGIAHRAQAGENPLVFLEIAFGEFDEGDIVRIEDRYGRS